MSSNKRVENIKYISSQFYGLIKSSNSTKSKEIPQISINPFGSFGVNYFITPRFAIGAEYGIGPKIDFSNGKRLVKINNTFTYDDGSSVNITEENESPASKNLEVNLNQQVGLHFIYVFDKDKSGK